MIFVQIASYRDTELIHTIEDCIQKAKFPEEITFGICWQHGDDEDLVDFFIDRNIKFIDVDYKESKGACWARSLTQSLYNKEHFTMQIDSHSRFIQDWDDVLIKMWNELGDPKAILTCYPPNYTPGRPESEWYHTPQICNIYKFIHKYTVSRPMDMPDWQTRTSPRRGVFTAAGFIFGPGSIIEDVPYDPQFYFTGEEIALAIRFFTHGYNIYHPHKLILHHYYQRLDHKKHWSDHENWGTLDVVAHQRLDALLGYNDIDLEQYGLGKVRTLEDYKNYAGIDFKNCVVHELTEKGNEPPCVYDEEGWNNIKEEFRRVLSWDPALVNSTEDATFWAFIILDRDGIAIDRWDATYLDNKNILDKTISDREFSFEYNPKKQIPTNLMIWPFSFEQGWLESINFPIVQTF